MFVFSYDNTSAFSNFVEDGILQHNLVDKHTSQAFTHGMSYHSIDTTIEQSIN